MKPYDQRGSTEIAHSYGAKGMMLHEAVDGLKARPDAIANAVAMSLIRQYGDDASGVADKVVARVQHYRRCPPKDYAPDPEIDLTPPARPRRVWHLIAAMVLVIVTVTVAALGDTPPPYTPAPGEDTCKTKGC